MGILGKLFGKQDNVQNSGLAVVNNKLSTSAPLMAVHPDFRDYIWVGDGKYKNYTPLPSKTDSFIVNGRKITITVSFGCDEEPSLIYTSLPIAFDVQNVERPPYFPSYKNLTPEQRGVYWKFLANPYDTSFDIGYVFILYYGLERFLLTNKYENVINLIISLRDIHTNKSFQHYTANAIILTCMRYQRPDIVLKFMNSLDKEHESNFSDDLFLLCKHQLNLPVTVHDLIRMAKSFEFKKTTYIKQHPELFAASLANILRTRYGSDTVFCSSLISEQEFINLPQKKVSIFANLSIRESSSVQDKAITVPMITSGPNFRKTVYDLLDSAHEAVKVQLAAMRKNGVSTPESAKKTHATEKKPLIFDQAKETELIDRYIHLPPNSLDQHFACIDIQNFYYSYRDLGPVFLDRCITYCLDDISRLPDIQAAYRKDPRNAHLGVFDGRIPAYERLAIIYEKQKEFEKAIDVCDKAIQYYGALGLISHRDDFVARKQKLVEKDKKHKAK